MDISLYFFAGKAVVVLKVTWRLRAYTINWRLSSTCTIVQLHCWYPEDYWWHWGWQTTASAKKQFSRRKGLYFRVIDGINYIFAQEMQEITRHILGQGYLIDIPGFLLDTCQKLKQIIMKTQAFLRKNSRTLQNSSNWKILSWLIFVSKLQNSQTQEFP